MTIDLRINRKLITKCWVGFIDWLDAEFPFSKASKKSGGILIVAPGDSPPKKEDLDPSKFPDRVFISATECVNRGGTLVCTSAGCGCYIDSEGICIPID